MLSLDILEVVKRWSVAEGGSVVGEVCSGQGGQCGIHTLGHAALWL